MKTVSFKLPPKPIDIADAWVKSRDAVEREQTGTAPAVAVTTAEEPMKRFTIDVPASLHTRIKSQCALRGTKMADVLREILEREFPQVKS